MQLVALFAMHTACSFVAAATSSSCRSVRLWSIQVRSSPALHGSLLSNSGHCCGRTYRPEDPFHHAGNPSAEAAGSQRIERLVVRLLVTPEEFQRACLGRHLGYDLPPQAPFA
ncbi:hypothetical protein HRbin30_01005 [bacterium HR30]|nr:hypothetical protein HRbin30_01005 [bacterium HR30]